MSKGKTQSIVKTSGKGAAIKIIAVLLALIAAAYVVVSLVFGQWNPLQWNAARQAQQNTNTNQNGGNQNDGNGAGNDEEQAAEENCFVINESESTDEGVQLFSAKLPRAAYAANGVSAQAETAYLLTATIEPADLEDKTVDWWVTWENGSSAWASGKTVSDYVRIVPRSDGALTANAECLQAFAEPVIITVAPRVGGEYLNATCKADYVQKVLGLSFDGKAMTEKGKEIYSFHLDPTNLNPVIDFPSDIDPEVWGYYYAQYGKLTREYVTSTVYTKAVSSDFAHYVSWTVSATSDYLNALRAGGLSPYSSVSSSQFVSNNNQLGGFFFKNWVNGVCNSAANWSAFRTSLRDNSDKVMLQIKCEWGKDASYGTCTYNVKFSPASLKALATNIEIEGNGGIEF